MPRLSLPELLDRSDVVVTGRVMDRSVSVDLSSDGRPRRIWTRTKIEVLSQVKGNPGLEVSVLELGGTSGRYSMVVPGAASLVPGEEVLLFLRCPEPACVVVGLAQGKYRLTTDPTNGRRVARRDFADESPIDLDALVAEIRRHAK